MIETKEQVQSRITEIQDYLLDNPDCDSVDRETLEGEMRELFDMLRYAKTSCPNW